MLQHEENYSLLHAITSESHLKYTCLNTDSVNVNENMDLSLFCNALSVSVLYITSVRCDGDYDW